VGKGGIKVNGKEQGILDGPYSIAFDWLFLNIPILASHIVLLVHKQHYDMPSTTFSTRRNLLYVGVALNAFTIFKHTQIGFSRIFPRLDSALGPGDVTAFSARMCYLIFSTGCVGTGEPPKNKKKDVQQVEAVKLI
jgi:hypothetical protein